MIILNTSNRVGYGTVGTAFDATVTDVNAPFDEILSGTLPPGLSWTDGVIDGTPTTAGVYEVEIYFYNGTIYTQGTLTLVISEAPVATVGLSDSNLKAYGTVGQPLDVASEFTPEATKFVTSYTLQAGTLQTGLSFDLSGKIRGIPRAAGVAALTVRVNQINTSNVTSTVDKAVQIIIQPAARDRYALRADLELSTRKLTFLGAGELPIFNRGERVDILLATYYEGIKRYLPANGLAATFKHLDVEEPIALNDLEDVTVSTEYLETSIEFPADDFDGILARGTDLTTTGVSGYLQLQIMDFRDLRYYDSTSSSVETVTTGENHNDSFAFNLSALWDDAWTTAPMTLDLAFTCPDDSALDMSYTRTFTLSKSGGNFTITGAAGTTTQTEQPTDVADYAVTLALTSITGNTTTVTVATNLSAESQTLANGIGVGENADFTIELVSGVYRLETVGGLTWEFVDGGAVVLYTYTLAPGATRTAAQISSDLTAGLGVAVSCLINPAPNPSLPDTGDDGVFIYGLTGVQTCNLGDAGSGLSLTNPTDPRSPTLTGCTVSARLRGLPGTNYYQISSLPTPVRIVRDH